MGLHGGSGIWPAVIFSGRARSLTAALGVVLVILCVTPPVLSDAFEDSPPSWEPLLWGGPIVSAGVSEPVKDVLAELTPQILGTATGPQQASALNGTTGDEPVSEPGPETGGFRIGASEGTAGQEYTAPPAILRASREVAKDYYREPYQMPALRRIPPLYSSPPMPGEGVWESRGTPQGPDGRPVMFRTSYRPSEEFPNAVVHMLLLDMRRLSARLYIGSSEPGAKPGSSAVSPEDKSRLRAITNALWKQKHSGEAGTVFQGEVLKKLVPGVATIVVFNDGTVDILEWNDDIPISSVRDAKQLRHLIVKNGKVVTSVSQGRHVTDAEIGLGYLLVEDEMPNPYYQWGGWWGGGPLHTSGEYWYIATRSAFGIRADGNLVFAIGHHISTRDLAKALVLAGCDRAIHGDANPHNVVGNLYFNDGNGNLAKKEVLSPDQKGYTLDRYLEKTYTSDFFGFFTREDEKDSS